MKSRCVALTLEYDLYYWSMALLVSKWSIWGAYEDRFILVGQKLRVPRHDLWSLSWAHSYPGSSAKSLQKLLGPTLLPPGLQIPDVSATWNSCLFLLGPGKLQFCWQMAPGRKPAVPGLCSGVSLLLAHRVLQRPWFLPETVASYVPSSFLDLRAGARVGGWGRESRTNHSFRGGGSLHPTSLLGRCVFLITNINDTPLFFFVLVRVWLLFFGQMINFCVGCSIVLNLCALLFLSQPLVCYCTGHRHNWMTSCPDGPLRRAWSFAQIVICTLLPVVLVVSDSLSVMILIGYSSLEKFWKRSVKKSFF